ncbi:hypothetical protein EMPS_06858 [Entomortierella parvispora]|uniref:F-box domain-containing protein n=1 Tax=Entomortierella parvispora TaxID=205924 RepID=A0A9P3LY50_9FUNG|nr:hypothetical protein EMPS_06858 [Entomortierella parvispora]
MLFLSSMTDHHHQQQEQEEQQELAEEIYPPLNPICMPEILHRCGRFMTRASLLRSILVCHQWHFNLLPQLWSSVQMSFHDKPVKYPHSTVFEDNASSVLALSVSSRFFMEFPDGCCIVCPRLQLLTIMHGTTRDSTFVDDSKVKLIRDHQSTLRALSINRVSALDLIDVITGCPQLEELTIGLLQMESEQRWLPLYEHLFSRMKVLSIGETRIGDSGALNDPIALAKTPNGMNVNLRKLDLGTFPDRNDLLPHLISILRSPGLDSLRLKSPSFGWMEWLADEVSSRRFTAPLDRLALPGRYFEDRHLEAILLGLPGLFRLDLSETNFSMDTLTLLRNDLPETMSFLQELDLRHCQQVTGNVVQELLSSLSGLEIFAADYVTDIDILDGGWSWACVGLKQLTLGVVLCREMTQDLVLAQIGRLERLQELDMILKEKHPYWESSSEKVRNLALTRGQGLDRLKNLCRLKSFKAHSHDDFPWKAAEASWALRNWVALEELELRGLGMEARQILVARSVRVHDVPVYTKHN